MAYLPKVSQWIDDIQEFSLNDFITGGAGGNDNEPHRILSDRTLFLKKSVEDLGDEGKRFVANNTGVFLSYLSSEVKLSNAHFTSTYPVDGKITKDWAISSGLASLDPQDNTRTQWFAIAGFNAEAVDNALAVVQGIFYYAENGYSETPLAYANDVSSTRIEVVALRSYRQPVAQFPIVPNAINPYGNVHLYVQDQVTRIVDENKNDNTGEVIALPKFNDWYGGIKDYYIKTVKMDKNPWMDKQFWQPVLLYVRFANVSASNSTSSTRNQDSPSYTAGEMIPQPINLYGNAFVQDVAGTYKYRLISTEVENNND